MNRDDIIRMADETGLFDYLDLEGDSVGQLILENFATLVAAAEREACAKVCEEWFTPNLGREATAAIAAAIRARGSK